MKAGGNVPPTSGGPTIMLNVGACVVVKVSGSRSSSGMVVDCEGCKITFDVGDFAGGAVVGMRMAGKIPKGGDPALVAEAGEPGIGCGELGTEGAVKDGAGTPNGGMKIALSGVEGIVGSASGGGASGELGEGRTSNEIVVVTG